MRLEDLDYDALINQMWGSEANLQSYLDSQVTNLCGRICGPEALVPTVKVTYPSLKGRTREGVAHEVSLSTATYRSASNSTPATIRIPALIAGNKSRVPQYLSFALILHWEALGAIGGNAFEYPEVLDTIIKESFAGVSEKDFKESHSPQFIAKAVKVARDLEIPLREFLFPKMSLSVYMPRPEEGDAEAP